MSSKKENLPHGRNVVVHAIESIEGYERFTGVLPYLCFAMHIPPERFVRIRHYGLLSSTSKKTAIPLSAPSFRRFGFVFIDMRKIKPYDRKICPCCGNASMITLEILPARGPPKPATGQKLAETKSQTVTV